MLRRRLTARNNSRAKLPDEVSGGVSFRQARESLPSERSRGDRSVADIVAPRLSSMYGNELPVTLEFWDGSVIPCTHVEVGRIHCRSPHVVCRLLWSSPELALARAFAAGELDFEGDIMQLMRWAELGSRRRRNSLKSKAGALSACFSMRVAPTPLPPPPEETRLPVRLHSRRNDRRAISHHYDLSNRFYELVVGPSMAYSCARFDSDDATLESAQRSKHELICRKLGLHRRAGMRLLDVGCGWGSMAIHAAQQHGAKAVGVTISRAQADLARKLVAERGLRDSVEIRFQDYRDLADERFDAICSVGMFEHIGARQADHYFKTLRALLAPGGRILNHAISAEGGLKLRRRSLMGRYVFPGGELLDVADVVRALERSGLEVRDLESLREHYVKTLNAWINNLEANWDEAITEVGEGRAKVWHLYLAASAVSFEQGRISVNQILGVVPDQTGDAGMEPTRRDWETPA